MRNRIPIILPVLIAWCTFAFAQTTPPADTNKDLPVVRSSMAKTGNLKTIFDTRKQQTALDSAAFTLSYEQYRYKFGGLLQQGYFFEKNTGSTSADGPAFHIAVPPADEIQDLKDDLQDLSQDKRRQHIEQLNFADRFIVFLTEKDETTGNLTYNAIIVYEETIFVFSAYAPWSEAIMEEFRGLAISVKRR